MAISNYIPPSIEATQEEIEHFRNVFESLDHIGKARIFMLTALVARNDMVTNAALKKMDAGRLTNDDFFVIVSQQYQLMVGGNRG